MRVLVSGAAGFLGRSLVPALLARGHEVRAMVRPTCDLATISWQDQVEVFRADLRVHDHLEDGLSGIDALIHLAARMTGPDELRFRDTVVGTERLLGAMADAGTTRLVLASSLAVYDWSAARASLDESTPVEPDLAGRSGYPAAKAWQERLARQAAERHGWRLTVLRPGYIWGRRDEWLYGMGVRIGPGVAVVGAPAKLPLTHVSNCADAFATALESERAWGETYNVVDGHPVSRWRYAQLYQRAGTRHGPRLPVPYHPGLAGVTLLDRGLARIGGGTNGLPTMLTREGFMARFRPLACDNDKLRAELGWSPPHDLEECLHATFGSKP